MQKEFDKSAQQLKSEAQLFEKNAQGIGKKTQSIGQGEQLSKQSEPLGKEGRQVFLTAVAKWNQSEGLPKLLYTPMLFRRRLSALTKITIEVLNRLFIQYPKAKQYPITFVSRRNERNVQFDVNKSLISDGEVLPATFSLSVFNTAVSQASIYFGIKSPYTVIDTGEGRVSDALRVAASPILTGDSEGAVFVFAEEALRDEYKGLAFGGAVGYALVLESCFESSCNKARNIDKLLWGGGDE